MEQHLGHAARLLVPLLLPVALACHGKVDTVVVQPAPSLPPTVYLDEDEPNNDPSFPTAVGPIAAGETYVLRGDASAWYDPFDGFAFAAHGDLYVEFELLPTWGYGDLDLSVYDPYLGEYVGLYTSDGSWESGALTIGHGGEFHLVVSAYAGHQSYELEVRVYGLAAAMAEGRTDGQALAHAAGTAATDATAPRAIGAMDLEQLEREAPDRATFHRQHLPRGLGGLLDDATTLGTQWLEQLLGTKTR